MYYLETKWLNTRYSFVVPAANKRRDGNQEVEREKIKAKQKRENGKKCERESGERCATLKREARIIAPDSNATRERAATNSITNVNHKFPPSASFSFTTPRSAEQ
jgi:hypothetical protein